MPEPADAQPLWTCEELLAATGGRLGGARFDATGVSFDSREIGPGELFVALKGERDGHAFAQKFGIARHIEFALRVFGNRSVDFIRRADRNRTFCDDNGVLFEQSSDLLGAVQDVGQIGFAGCCGRRPP